MKLCPDCNRTLPLTEFGMDKFTKSGLTTYCKTCKQARRSDYASRNKEKIKSQKRKQAKNRYYTDLIKLNDRAVIRNLRSIYSGEKILITKEMVELQRDVLLMIKARKALVNTIKDIKK